VAGVGPGLGGRQAGSKDCSQNLDSYAIEYLSRRHQGPGQRPLLSQVLQRVRHLPPRHEVRRPVLGNIHAPEVHLYKDQRIAPDNVQWSRKRSNSSLAGRVGTTSWTTSATTGRTTRAAGPRCPAWWR